MLLQWFRKWENRKVFYINWITLAIHVLFLIKFNFWLNSGGFKNIFTKKYFTKNYLMFLKSII